MSVYNNSYLQHYGVIGMRWGIRKANKYSGKSLRLGKQAKAAAESGDSKAAARLKKKSSAYASKATATTRTIKRKAGTEAYNYTKKESATKSLAKAMVFGDKGAMIYNRNRAKGQSRAFAGGKRLAVNVTENVAREAIKKIAPYAVATVAAAVANKAAQNRGQSTIKQLDTNLIWLNSNQYTVH